MKYCVHCGAEIFDEAIVCVKCGRKVEIDKPVVVDSTKDDTMNTIIKVFLILGCIAQGWLIIPLAWCIPITVSIFSALKEERPISTTMKVCTLLFVSMVSGICLLCMNEERNERGKSL